MAAMSYRDAVGRTRRRTEWIDPLPIRRMEDLLDLPREESNGVVPVPWHWIYCFSESVPNRRVGADGHPLRGDFLPPIDLPRRMFAGCEIRSHADLKTGRPATVVETIESIDEKQGAAGPLVFVTVEVAVRQDGADVLVEKRRLVYLDPGGRRIPMPEPRPFPSGDPGETALEWVPQHQELFRYSALTYNGHRIHYDADYARDVEGYPAVVVHGPLTATRLALLARDMTGAAVSALSVRGSAPLFVGQPVRLTGRAEGGGRVRLSAMRCDGTPAMEGWAETVR
jgi:3-methylfumaryl-CoA hydratase